MPAFSKLLLDALRQSPPTSLEGMRSFFDRSRARLEESLDKSGVTDTQRQAYLDQFEAGAEEAQTVFVDHVLSTEQSEVTAGPGSPRELFSQPVVLALVAGAFVFGLGLGSMLF